MGLAELPDRDERPLLQKWQMKPALVVKAAKKKAETSEWRRVCSRVDARDKRVCQITGVPLTADTTDTWRSIERHHLEYRSQNKSRRFNDRNVLTVSRGVHQLIHGGALRLLNKRGQPIRHVDELDHVQWNRDLVPRGDEPCRLKRGLPHRRD